MLIPFDEIRCLFYECVKIGFMEAVRAYEPTQDKIRVADVDKWLKIMLIDKKKFKQLVKNGVIRPHKGKAINSPHYYSKKEIQQAITAAKLSSIITKERLREELI